MTDRLIQFDDDIHPLKASSLAILLSNTSIIRDNLVTIITEAAYSVAGRPARYQWDTDEEQHVYNVLFGVILHSSKIVKGK